MIRLASRCFAALALTLTLLAGCSHPPRSALQTAAQASLWSGRLALRVDSDQARSFSAGFELKGNAQAGELSLYSPLGATIAQLDWTSAGARLRWEGKERSFDSLGELTREATGTELPVASIFLWLAGDNASAPGWQADLRELPNGRLVARRTTPPPAVEMRLVLE